MRKLAGCKYKLRDSRQLRAGAAKGLLFSVMPELSGQAK
jgi:hypothetical protein